VFVPDGLLASRLVSNGAKLLWARLARYAGTRGQCFPLLATLAADLGFSDRQVQRYLAELVSGGFLRARQRGYNKSNVYEFLWHAALGFSVVAARGPEQAERQTHNLQREESVLSRGVESQFQPFQPTVPERFANAMPSEEATDLSPRSTTGLASCVSTTGLSSWKNDSKKRIELQAKPSQIVEVVEVLAGSACPPPEKAKRPPLTEEETAVRDKLVAFQTELRVAGTILPSTVRKVMTLVPTERLPEALRLVADKLYWRRRNESSYRRHVGWGFVLRVLEQDLAVPTAGTTAAEKRPGEPLVNPTGTAPPFAVSQRRRPLSLGQRGGLLSAGDILADLGVVELTGKT
jgi:hypothetical protein